MWALFVATVYFGTFLVIGWVAKRVLDRWMDQRGVELSEVQKQAGRRGERTVFLLGAWRKESDALSRLGDVERPPSSGFRVRARRLR